MQQNKIKDKKEKRYRQKQQKSTFEDKPEIFIEVIIIPPSRMCGPSIIRIISLLYTV